MTKRTRGLALVQVRDPKGRIISSHEIQVETEYVPRSVWHGLEQLEEALKPGQRIVEASTGRALVVAAI